MGNFFIPSRPCDGEIVFLPIDRRLTVHFVPDRLQEEVVVGTVARRSYATAIQPSPAWVFPIHVDAIKPVLHHDVDGRFRKICPLLCIPRNRVERGR